MFRREPRLENQTLRRIPSPGQLRCEHEFRARRRDPLIRAGDQVTVSPQISDGWVNLSETNLHAVPRQVMRNAATSNVLLSTLPTSLARRLACHAAVTKAGSRRSVRIGWKRKIANTASHRRNV